jgi:hypothetical protein
LLILTTTVRAQDQTAPGFHPAGPSYSGRQRHSLPKLHTHWMTTPSTTAPSSRSRPLVVDPSSTKSYSPFKRTCLTPKAIARGRKLLREAGTTFRQHRFRGNNAQPGAAANHKPEPTTQRPSAT